MAVVLITGGFGFIGMHAAHRFLEAGDRVIVTQHQARREPEMLRQHMGKALSVERLDVTSPYDAADVVHRNKVTDIVHLVAPRLGALSPTEEFRMNISGLINVLEAGRLHGVRRVLVASSQSVYTGLPEGPYREEMPLPMTSANATEAFKKSFEVLALHYADRTGLPVVMMRIGGVYGPLYYSMFNLPSRLCHAAVKGAAPDFKGVLGGPPRSDDEGGDFVFVKDVARGIQALQAAEKLNHRIYNVGGGRLVKLGEIAEAVQRMMPAAQVALQPGRSPQGRTNSYMDMTRIKQEVGHEPQYDIYQGIAEYLAWLREHPE